MKKSKLIDILSCLKKDEIKQFRDFINSPFFNKKKEVITFFELLIQYYPHFEEKDVDRHHIFNLLYPKKEYDEKQLGYLMSYLSKLAERFIGFQKYEADNLMPEYHLLSAFIERKLYKYYLQSSKKVSSTKNSELKKNSDAFLKDFLISKVALQYFDFQLKEKRRHDESLQIASNNLDLFYLTKKLEYSCAMINHMNLLGEDYQLYFANILNNKMIPSPFKDEPIIVTYLQIFQMLQTEVTPEQLATLRKLIKEKGASFPTIEKQKFLRYAINFCLQMLRKGKYEYMEQAFELYLEGIKQGSFYEDSYLSLSVYANVIRIGASLKKFDFLKEFVEEYNPKLPKELQKNSYHYNMAEIYYGTKDFDQAIEHLNQVKFSDIQIHLGSREILTKIYFETDAEEALLSLIASFSIFLKRNKNISTRLKRPYLNFCDLLNQIMRKNPKKLVIIRQKITETNPLASRSWLLQACDKVMQEVGVKV